MSTTLKEYYEAARIYRQNPCIIDSEGYTLDTRTISDPKIIKKEVYQNLSVDVNFKNFETITKNSANWSAPGGEQLSGR